MTIQRSELETKDNHRYDEKQQILIDVTRQLQIIMDSSKEWMFFYQEN